MPTRGNHEISLESLHWPQLAHGTLALKKHDTVIICCVTTVQRNMSTVNWEIFVVGIFSYSMLCVKISIININVHGKGSFVRKLFNTIARNIFNMKIWRITVAIITPRAHAQQG